MKTKSLLVVLLSLVLILGLSVFNPASAQCPDADGDGYTDIACGGTDCNDSNPGVNPGANEICDGFDTNCDGYYTWTDVDSDGDGVAFCAGDCNDNDAAIFPGNDELCGDGKDNDCDYWVDEAACVCPDADGDGHQAAYCGGDDCDDTDDTVYQNCTGCTDSDGDNFSVEGGACGPIDCDDTDAGVNPGAAEICDGKDTNCDGYWSWTDVDNDGDGVPRCANDCNDNEETVYPGAPELCDGLDNDCNYRLPVNEQDRDGDGYLGCGGDCNDNDPFINPGEAEACGDGVDNNCNSQTDEAGCICPDADGDGHTAAFCGGDDCDDTNGTVYPGAAEECTDGVDNDCNGLTDCADPNAVNCPPITDADGDGYDIDGVCGAVDCDDSDANVNPGAPEICDGKDSNCDGFWLPTDVDVDGDGVPLCANDCDDNDPDNYPGNVEVCDDGADNNCNGVIDAADAQCQFSCVTDPNTKNGPHIFNLLEQGTDALIKTSCSWCHYDDSETVWEPTACQRCHADSADTSDPLNGVLKDLYPAAPPYGFTTAPNVKMHSSAVVGTKYGNWDMSCMNCHNPHADEQNDRYGTSYGMLVKEYVCYDNVVTMEHIENLVEFTSATGAGSFADGPPHNENICNTCHTRTNHHQNDGTAPGGQDHNNGTDCMQCHAHDKGFAPSGAAPPHDFISNCEYCHVSTTDFTTKIPDSKCDQCHTPDGVLKLQFPDNPPDGFGTAPDVLTHSDINGSGNYTYTKDCVDCHEPMFGTPNIAHVRTDLSAAGGGDNIVFTERTGTDSFADGPPYTENVCNTCHSNTNHHQADGSAPGGQDHNNNADCALCHPHGDAFLPTGGDCLACHNQSPPAGSSDPDRRQIVEGTAGDGMGDFVKASHHVTDGTSTQIITAEDCEICHDQSIHTSFGDGQSVLLNDQDVVASYTYDGSGASVEGFCVSCHDADGSLINGSQPFIASGDTNSPADIGWSAGVVSHSTFDVCFNCHAQGHGSDFGKILAEDNEPGLCFNCHDADGPASTDLDFEFAKQFGHPVTASSSSIQCLDCHNPHQTEPGTHTPDGQWYPSSPDANTNLVSGVLSGVRGVEPSPWAPSWTKTDSYTVVDPAEKEYQICFKCHARYSHQYSQDCLLCHPATWDPVNGAIVIGFQFRSAQREFNINNKSAHPVVVTSNNQSGSYAPKALSSSQLEAPWTNAGNQTMYCSDCHGASDELSTGIRGPHGSDQESMLKGPNTMWPAGSVRLFSLNDISDDSGAPESLNTNWRNELFCLNCHDSFPSSNKNTWKNEAHKEHDDRDYSPLGGGSGDGDSNVYCIACHAIVPHGAQASRLITYRSELAEYNTYNGVNYNVLQGFAKASPFGYDKANCFTMQGFGCHPHENDRGSEVGGYDP